MHRISKKRLRDLGKYKDAKKNLFIDDLKRGNLYCFFSGKQIKISEELRHESDDSLISLLDCHHINQERENERLYDTDMMVPVLRYYHTQYHSLSVKQLLLLPWYQSFLVRLKNKSYEVYRKEMNKQLKANLITQEEYDAKTTF